MTLFGFVRYLYIYRHVIILTLDFDALLIYDTYQEYCIRRVAGALPYPTLQNYGTQEMEKGPVHTHNLP